MSKKFFFDVYRKYQEKSMRYSFISFVVFILNGYSDVTEENMEPNGHLDTSNLRRRRALTAETNVTPNAENLRSRRNTISN